MRYGLNHDQVELMKGPTLSSSLPVVFDNSEKIDGIVMRCPECDRTVPDVLVRGRVQRPTVHVAVVDAGCYCEHCDTFGMQTLRFYDDGRAMFFNGKAWKEFDADPPSFWDRAKRYFAPRHNI